MPKTIMRMIMIKEIMKIKVNAFCRSCRHIRRVKYIVIIMFFLFLYSIFNK